MELSHCEGPEKRGWSDPSDFTEPLPSGPAAHGQACWLPLPLPTAQVITSWKARTPALLLTLEKQGEQHLGRMSSHLPCERVYGPKTPRERRAVALHLVISFPLSP